MSQDDQKNGSLGGRPTSLDKLGISKEDIWNLAVQGLTNTQISKRLSRSKGKISVRTVATYRALMQPDYKAQFDDFERLPQVPEFKNWIASRFENEKGGNQTYNHVKHIWEQCWRKPLESLTEQDIIKAISWIKETYPSGQFQPILAIRALIRFGIGDPSWLTKHLSTKGKKAEPRTVALLQQAVFYDEIFPRMLQEAAKAAWLTPRQRDELVLALALKVSSGIRSGDRKKERELWGTQLFGGKTNLQYRNGKIIDWIVFAKKKEIWHIRFLPPPILKLLGDFIAKYSIKPGLFLIQELEQGKALKSVKQICKNLEIEPLTLHDFRKAYLTGLCLAGIPLETAVDLNVGWKDINTARKHYLQIKAMNADTEFGKFSARFFK
jgi:hypothetical protein